MDAQQMLRSLDDERERGLRAFSEANTLTELEAAEQEESQDSTMEPEVGPKRDKEPSDS